MYTQDGNTPLHKAAERNDLQALKLLMQYEADPCAQNNVRSF